jgi:hypothetical protein
MLPKTLPALCAVEVELEELDEFEFEILELGTPAMPVDPT